MKAVWGKELQQEKNIHLVFGYTYTPQIGDRLELAASNLYRLFVDGNLVGYGPARAAHGYSRLDTYSLSDWAGKPVTVSVEVYSANVNSYYTVEEPPFFAAELYRGKNLLAEATDFTACHMTGRVQKTRRFSFQRTFSEVYRLDANADYPEIETQEVTMNRLLPRYVSYPTLELLTGRIIETGCVDLKPDGDFFRDRAYDELDQVFYKGFYPEELEEDAPRNIARFAYAADKAISLTLSTMGYRIYDFSRTVTGFFSLTATIAEKATLYILFDEVLTNGQVDPYRNTCCNIIQYTLSPGIHQLLSFEANSARFATVVLAGGRGEVSDFGMRLYENPDVRRPLPDCGDRELNAIMEAAANTFAQNAVDVLTDCPSRERAGWLCDSYFSGRAEGFFTGDHRVERSFLENYGLFSPKPWLADGMIPMCYPADHYKGNYIPNWSMWYILELRSYVERTGDQQMRKLSEEKVRGLVEFFKKYENEYGLLENLESWVFVEWSKCNEPEYIAGVNYPSNMLWAAALEAAADLYGWEPLREKAEAMRRTIRQLSYNGQFFEENAIRDDAGGLVKTGHTTETCQYYAFYFGVASPETYEALFERMRTVFGPRRNAESVYPTVYPSNAIVGNYLRLEILLQHGFYQQVLQECKDFFTPMAQLTGTLWEHSRLSASLNHGFASVAALYIDRCVKACQHSERQCH